jgi:hypothetical protein
MPRQSNHGETRGEKHIKPSWQELFPAPHTEGPGAWRWTNLRPGLMAEAADAANMNGDAISFATNRAQTAGSITLLTGGDRPKKWVNTYDEAEQLLDSLIEMYASRQIP